jgi:hypothetical protein
MNDKIFQEIYILNFQTVDGKYKMKKLLVK